MGLLFRGIKAEEKNIRWLSLATNIIITIMLLYWVGALLPSSTISTTTSDVKKNEAPTVSKATTNIGDIATIDNVNYKIIAYKKTPALGTPHRMLILIGVQANNIGKEPKDISPPIVIIDENGYSYNMSPDSSAYFGFGEVNPGLSAGGSLIFEIPSSAKGLKLKIEDAYINLSK